MRFFYEIEIMKKLDHPNILKLYEVFQDQKRFYLVTELCTGGELYEEISKKRVFPEDEAAEVIQQILEAIAYCHANHIVHRDLKPENLLIDQQSCVELKVIDFGTSQQFAEDKTIEGLVGTAYYIAPEVLSGSYNHQCDIWSIGIIMAILLTGKPPFDGADDREVVKKVRMGHFSTSGPEWDNVDPLAVDMIK